MTKNRILTATAAMAGAALLIAGASVAVTGRTADGVAGREKAAAVTGCQADVAAAVATVRAGAGIAVGHRRKDSTDVARRPSPTARRMAEQGLVDIASADPTVKVSLMYARADNFTGRVLYDDLREAYLHPLAAEALKKAQARLKELRPDLSLKIYDATRPMSVQQKMWDAVKDTGHSFYVSNPKNGGGLHNYGLAVDITLCRADGDTLTMGTKVDNMDYLSHIDREKELLAAGKLSREAYDNRRLLRDVMRHAGWMPLRTEWWHFNLRTRAQARKYFKVVR